MKRVLVIAYYFPPMGLSGVQRIAKFVKYLPEYGWAPTVLTVDPGGYFAFDHSLEKDFKSDQIRIERTPSIDPTRLFKRKSTVALPRETSRKWLSRLSQALFIPDNKIGWINPAVRRGVELHEERPFDMILATIPPYSAALVAYKLSKKTGVRYVLDYRDDWLDNPRHVYPTFIHRSLHRAQEKKALSKCSAVISINERIAERISARIESYFKDNSPVRVEVISQGFDAEDFAGKQPITKDGTLTLVYSGVFYDAQTPDFFLKALALFVKTYPQVRSRIRSIFVGLVPESSKALIESLGLADVVECTGYIPHAEVIEYLFRADVLWMTVGEGEGQELISTSKVYEYMGMEKPILGLVPDGAARDVLETYKACWLVDPGSVDDICKALKEIYQVFEKGVLPVPASGFSDQIERKYLTGLLCKLLDASSSF